MSWIKTLLAGVGDVTDYNDKYANAGADWIYYLCGAIFIVIGLISLWYTWKIRNTKKEYETIAVSFGYWKLLWYKYRYPFMIIVTVAIFAIAITFFLLPNTIDNLYS